MNKPSLVGDHETVTVILSCEGPAMRMLPIVLAALVLAGCQKRADVGPAGPSSEAGTTAAADITTSKTQAPPLMAQLAYSYDYGLAAPSSKLRGLMDRHEAECVSAGPAQCQVVGSSLADRGRKLQGELQLRAAPAWLKGFRANLAGDADAVGGKLFRSDVKSEDLSRSIVDTEADLRAKVLLRDRLQGLLATHPGKLSDLLELEKQAASVQGEIDAARSELAVMQQRVATSDLTIHYESAGLFAPEGTWAPLGEALDGVTGALATTLAGFVLVLAWTLPWLAAGGAVYWFLNRRKPRKSARPVAASAPSGT
jgi:hypothetical protein